MSLVRLRVIVQASSCREVVYNTLVAVPSSLVVIWEKANIEIDRARRAERVAADIHGPKLLHKQFEA